MPPSEPTFEGAGCMPGCLPLRWKHRVAPLKTAESPSCHGDQNQAPKAAANSKATLTKTREVHPAADKKTNDSRAATQVSHEASNSKSNISLSKHSNVSEQELEGTGSTRGRNRNTLIALSKSGKLEEIITLCTNSHQDVNVRGMWGNTALICACQNCHQDVALELLRRGADAVLYNEDGCTAFHHACLEGLEEVVYEMTKSIAGRAPSEVKDMFKPAPIYNSKTDQKKFLTPLAAACINEHIRVVEHCLSEPVLLHAADRTTVISAFRQAIQAGSEKSAKLLLLEREHYLSDVVKQDSTLLARACQIEANDMVKLLLNAGCEVNSCLCFRSAEARGNLSPEAPLAVACRLGNSECALDLLAAGADPNYTCGQCSLPLTLACRAGEVDCVSVLVNAGAHSKVLDPVTSISPYDFVKNVGMNTIVEIFDSSSV